MKGKYPEYPANPIADIRDLFLESTRNYPDKTALQSKKGGRWVPINYGELRDSVEEFACGLAGLGLMPAKSKLAIVGDNRPEWAISYLSAACTGIICVPIDKDLKETEVYHILYLSGADAIVVDGKHVDMALDIQPKAPHLKHIINMDHAGERPGTIGFEDLKTLGRRRIETGQNDFSERTVQPEDLLAILFTSGTMGNSKGVMLTHGNVANNIVDAGKWVDLGTADRFLSVLPVHHTYECTDGFLLALYRGATISYAENLRRVAENLAETKTTAMLGVPLLWHAMYAKIEDGMAEKGMWKVNLARKLADISERVFHKNIRRRLFAQVHERFGGSLRILISGGAAVDPKVARGFRELGLKFLQGYGLTESAPIIAVNRNEAFKDEAAGLPLPSVEVKIAEDGEILARGPNIMKGYYNNAEATREALDNGWLHTGDLGYLDADGFLHVLGRKKAVIVTPAGKKIYPEEVEAELLRSRFISECLVWGESSNDPNREVDVQAIVVPNTEAFIQEGFEDRGALDSAKIEEVLRREVKERCRNLASFKRVTRLTVRHEEFEKTTTRKIKRYLYTKSASMLNEGKVSSGIGPS